MTNMKHLTLEQHRKRIENINSAERGNRKYYRRHRVRDYLPAQAVYNLGDYPYPFKMGPTEYDYNMLKFMAEKGVQLIQLHEEWNDAVRLQGADKFSCPDPKGLQEFVDLCHYFGIKVIPYISTGYFHEFDPDFREEFTESKHYCMGGLAHRYRRCSAGSAEWREYLLPRTFAVLDKYGFDGIYNDFGLQSSWSVAGNRPVIEGVGEYDPEMEDLIGTIYHEVKRRGGVYKLHCDKNSAAPCIDKVYDYLWIGETMDKSIAGIGKDYPDYIVPCQDKVCLNLDNPDYYFANVIPFMQFPLLTTVGRPFLGKRKDADCPMYGREDPKFNREWLFDIEVDNYMKAHPDGPYVYSLWSAIPDDVTETDRWAKYLALYRPMVEEDSLVYVDIRDCDDIASELPEKVYASMFVNEEKYLVISNLSDTDYTVRTNGNWTDRESGITGESFTVKPGKILFLIK